MEDAFETQETQAQPDGFINDPLATPEATVPPREPDAHRGRIESVAIETFPPKGDKPYGSTSITINLKSIDTGRDDRFRAFVPRDFVANVRISPDELPEEEGNNQRFAYRQHVSNTKKNATLQVLRQLAYQQGHSVDGKSYNDFAGFVALHAELLPGTELVYTRRPQKSDDPRFDGELQVSGFFSPEVVNNPKALKNYAKKWEA